MHTEELQVGTESLSPMLRHAKVLASTQLSSLLLLIPFDNEGCSLHGHKVCLHPLGGCPPSERSGSRGTSVEVVLRVCVWVGELLSRVQGEIGCQFCLFQEVLSPGESWFSRTTPNSYWSHGWKIMASGIHSQSRGMFVVIAFFGRIAHSVRFSLSNNLCVASMRAVRSNFFVVVISAHLPSCHDLAKFMFVCLAVSNIIHVAKKRLSKNAKHLQVKALLGGDLNRQLVEDQAIVGPYGFGQSCQKALAS